MKAFKITNITHLLGKRNFKENSELEFEYIDGMIKKTRKIKPKETIFLSLPSLPLSLHRLRINGLVTVTEISNSEMNAVLAANKKKMDELNSADENTKKNVKKTTTKKTTKKTTTKKDEDESSEKKYTRKTTTVTKNDDNDVNTEEETTNNE